MQHLFVIKMIKKIIKNHLRCNLKKKQLQFPGPTWVWWLLFTMLFNNVGQLVHALVFLEIPVTVEYSAVSSVLATSAHGRFQIKLLILRNGTYWTHLGK